MDAKKMLGAKSSAAWVWCGFAAVAIAWAALPARTQDAVVDGAESAAMWMLPTMPDCSFHRPFAGMDPNLGSMVWCMAKRSSDGGGGSSGDELTLPLPFGRH